MEAWGWLVVWGLGSPSFFASMHCVERVVTTMSRCMAGSPVAYSANHDCRVRKS